MIGGDDVVTEACVCACVVCDTVCCFICSEDADEVRFFYFLLIMLSRLSLKPLGAGFIVANCVTGAVV